MMDKEKADELSNIPGRREVWFAIMTDKQSIGLVLERQKFGEEERECVKCRRGSKKWSCDSEAPGCLEP